MNKGKRGNHEGSIYRRKDGRWAASISIERRRRKSYYGRTRQEVAQKLTTGLKTRQDGLPLSGERQTVAKYLVHWLEAAKPSLRPRTSQRYEQYLRLHAIPQIGNLGLARLGPQHLQELYADRLQAGLSPASVAHLHAVLHRALKQAARWGMLPRNVADLVSPPRAERHEMSTLSQEQARALLAAAAGDRLEAIYVLALATGMRLGELGALRWSDVDLAAGAVQVRGSLQRTPEGLRILEPKTNQSRRRVLLSEVAVEALRRHRARQLEERLKVGPAWEDNGLVFANQIGRPIGGDMVLKRSFRPLLRKANLPVIRFHDLRHTAATLLLERGIHPKIVSEMLGHSRIAITLDLYSHVTPTMQRQAAEAMNAVLGG